jgi:hypothetical protein
MFGYVNVYKPELKMKDYYKYKAYYCGLCQRLKTKYGHLGQITLTYDMTFLIILLTSLYESNTIREQHRCMVHPVKKQPILFNPISDYGADMNLILAYYHFLDDWQDEKSVKGYAGTIALKKDYKKISKNYPRQCNAIREGLERLKECERNQEKNLDLVAGCFGDIMSELFVMKQDMWENTLRKMGFYLGKFIYIIDAYEDIEKDKKSGNYNPFSESFELPSFKEDCRNILNIMMSDCAAEFEKLPCIIDIDILRNILYHGVWTKFDSIPNENNKIEEGTYYDNGSL